MRRWKSASISYLPRSVQQGLDDPVWTLEEGIRQLAQVPAALMGLHDRGTLRVGGWADIMIFDETVAPTRKEFTRDLPGGAGHWRARGQGARDDR